MTAPLDDDEPKKPSRATIIRRVLVVVLVLACAGGWLYTRVLVKKVTLGEPCSYDMHCRPEAPRCLKQTVEGDGVCSRSCDNDGDCAPDIKCVKVELDDRDERGRPIEAGYCFPQALIDARKKKAQREAGAEASASASASPKSDSWLTVPEAPGQLEAEVVLERNGNTVTYQVKGTLVRTERTKQHRTIVDTSTLRVYSVDDEKRTFSAWQIGVSQLDAVITKTEKKERVADSECELWKIEEPYGSKESRLIQEACVLRGGAFIDPGARLATAWERELAVRGGFPLRIVNRGKTKLVATKVDVHPLEASLFTIPKSYKNAGPR